ncbi:hypothetical protein [Nitrosopumilus sp.]|uniref:hypothetical protein n=1 Tax=Nitrosopumilus sp. TaxID=2024843 RepID=UPI002604CEA8|nr:hypothetical protein [Nitrosopumilus sp.]
MIHIKFPLGMPVREDGLLNYSCDPEIIEQLPRSWRKYWSYIDFDIVFEPEEPESPDNPLSNTLRESEKEVSILDLNKDRKTKLTAIALEELSDQEKEEKPKNDILKSIKDSIKD